MLCDDGSYRNKDHWCAKVREESAIAHMEGEYDVKKNTAMRGDYWYGGEAGTPAECVRPCATRATIA